MFSCWTHTCHMPVLRAQKPKWSSALLCRLSQGNSWQRGELVIALHCFSTCLTIPSRLLRSSIYSKKSIFLKPVVDGGVFFFFFFQLSAALHQYLQYHCWLVEPWSVLLCYCLCGRGNLFHIFWIYYSFIKKEREECKRKVRNSHFFLSWFTHVVISRNKTKQKST